MFNFWKKKKGSTSVFVQNNKPKDATYILIQGKELEVGDVIIHKHARCLVTHCNPGKGAGSFDFGEYIAVRANKLTGQVGFLEHEFWTYENCPVILEVNED